MASFCKNHNTRFWTDQVFSVPRWSRIASSYAILYHICWFCESFNLYVFYSTTISSAPDCPNIAYSDLHYSCIRSFSISVSIPTMTSADPRLWTFYRTYHSDMPDGSLGVIHISFAPQPLDLLSWLYVYLSDFGLSCNLIHHLALYQVSVRRLKSFATPLPPPLSLLLEACGSLRLAVNTRDWTFTN